MEWKGEKKKIATIALLMFAMTRCKCENLGRTTSFMHWDKHKDEFHIKHSTAHHFCLFLCVFVIVVASFSVKYRVPAELSPFDFHIFTKAKRIIEVVGERRANTLIEKKCKYSLRIRGSFWLIFSQCSHFVWHGIRSWKYNSLPLIQNISIHLQYNMHFIRTTKALLQFTRCSVCPLNRLNRPALLFCGKCEKWCVFTHWVKSRTFFQFVVSHTCDLRLRRYSLNSLEPNRMNSVNLSGIPSRDLI